MRVVPGTPTHVTTDADAQELGQRILDPQRRHPLVVISMDKDGRSGFDADEIAATLRIHADVWVIDDRIAWTLNRMLGNETVFGDAAGVFLPRNDGRLRRHLFTSGESSESVVAAARRAAPGRAPRAGTAMPPVARHVTAPPTTGLHMVETAAQVEALARYLLDPSRDRPVAVVTIPTTRVEPWIDPDEIVDAVGPEAEVHLIATGPRTFQLTSRLTRLSGVYGGAGRVYDIGQDWLRDPYLSPLRFAYDAGEGSRAGSALINDLMGALARTGHLTTQSTAAKREVSGKVSALIPPSRALVTLDDETLTTIWAELTAPGLDVDAILAPGMRVSGLLDPDTRRVDVSQMIRTPEAVTADLQAGVVVLATVNEVVRTSVTLTPYPGVSAALTAELVTGNDLDDLTDLLSPGEVVAARYLGHDDAASWQLSMIDVDDDEAAESIALLADGPPWLSVIEELVAPVTQTEVVAEEDEQTRLREALDAAETRLRELKATSLEGDDLSQRVAELETELRTRDMEVDTLQREIRDSLRTQDKLMRQVEHERTGKRRALQKSNKPKTSAPREVHGYSDPAPQLRWEILRTWVEQTRAEEKREWPLATDFLVGTEFCSSVDALEGVSRERVLHVLVRLLTGRGNPEDHVLRASKAGGAPAIVREIEGIEWVCRRAPLQQSSPSARRLSYWRSPSGQIELSRVTLHDDLAP